MEISTEANGRLTNISKFTPGSEKYTSRMAVNTMALPRIRSLTRRAGTSTRTGPYTKDFGSTENVRALAPSVTERATCMKASGKMTNMTFTGKNP